MSDYFLSPLVTKMIIFRSSTCGRAPTLSAFAAGIHSYPMDLTNCALRVDHAFIFLNIGLVLPPDADPYGHFVLYTSMIWDSKVVTWADLPSEAWADGATPTVDLTWSSGGKRDHSKFPKIFLPPAPPVYLDLDEIVSKSVPRIKFRSAVDGTAPKLCAFIAANYGYPIDLTDISLSVADAYTFMKENFILSPKSDPKRRSYSYVSMIWNARVVTWADLPADAWTHDATPTVDLIWSSVGSRDNSDLSTFYHHFAEAIGYERVFRGHTAFYVKRIIPPGAASDAVPALGSTLAS